MKKGFTLGLLLTLGLLTACGDGGEPTIDDAAQATAALGCSFLAEDFSPEMMDEIAQKYGFENAADIDAYITDFTAEEQAEFDKLGQEYIMNGGVEECEGMMDSFEL